MVGLWRSATARRARLGPRGPVAREEDEDDDEDDPEEDEEGAEEDRKDEEVDGPSL